MGITTPYISEIARRTYAINEFGLTTMFLLEGTQRALLIDTDCGLCDLPSVIKQLTDLPLTVALTHGHMDHSGGIGWFDKILMNERDFDMVRNVKAEGIRAYAESSGRNGAYRIYDYTTDHIKARDPMPQLIPLNEGAVIDLGERPIEVYEICGHTAGGLVFLDVKNRIMFSGDACNDHLMANSSSVRQTQAALEKFKTLHDKFDRNFNGHVGYMGSPDCFSQPDQVTDDLITLCKKVRSKELTGQISHFMQDTMATVTYGCAELSYDPARIEP